jgi:hypothetical protein
MYGKRGVQAARLPLEPGGTGSKLSYRSQHAQRSGERDRAGTSHTCLRLIVASRKLGLFFLLVLSHNMQMINTTSNWPGRPGWSPTQAPHRSGRAEFQHPVPHLMSSLPARSGAVTWTWFRSLRTGHVSWPRFMRRCPLPSPGSLRLVPLLQRYYEALRPPDSRFAALRFLRLAIPWSA